MPSQKVLEQKQQAVAELAERIRNSVAGVIVDYKGITVEDDTKLRKELRESGVKYTVVKNTLIKRAAEQAELNGIEDVLNGTSAIATSDEDYVAAARILQKFADKHENFTVKTGYLDNEVISLEKIKSLAKLPSREVLLANVLGAFQAPIASFARAVQAIVDKNGEEAPAEAAEA
ncbi:MAG: 50S ribosomal protein L10 [Clostridia bacterium]|nr:50S ribosomal protein L10 [Clostridia bacterium]